MASNLLNIYTNNSKAVIVDVYDADGKPFNCYGYIPMIAIKKLSTDTTKLVDKTGHLSGLTYSTLVFHLLPEDTNLIEGEYWYDVTLTDLTDIITVVYDKFRILQDVRYGK